MNPHRIFTFADHIVIAVAVVLVLSLYAVYWQPPEAGTVIEYQTPGNSGTLRLNQDGEFNLNGSNGISHIRIHDGAVRFIDSPCRNKHCIHSGWLHANGDFAACLPNRVTLLVRSDHEPEFDAINY